MSVNNHNGTPSAEDRDRRIFKLEKINNALMQRVERSMDQQANAFSLFQTAIALEGQIKARTDELKAALSNLAHLNDELVLARDSAERANRFKTRFFTAVGHDLLQPLHAARLSLAELIDSAQAPATRGLAENVGRALTNIEELLSTILDISKLEAGAFVPAIQPVALGPMFEALVRDTEPIARRKLLDIRWRPTAAVVRSDPMMLRRILQNLLANAVRYTERGGILLAARSAGNNVRVEVWDTGPGIGKDDRERIFEEFQQGRAPADAGRAGFGLGLSIVKRMAEALDHTLALTSQLGSGSRFAITLPGLESDFDAGQTPVFVAPQAQGYGTISAQVIVIENDIAVLDAMQSLLRRWGCDVRIGRDIDDVNDILSEPEFRPRLCIADFHLDHGLTGIDCIRAVRNRFGQSVPAVLITADHSPTTAALAHANGTEILNKPIRPGELRALVRHLTGDRP